jgi:hypothetical protein
MFKNTLFQLVQYFMASLLAANTCWILLSMDSLSFLKYSLLNGAGPEDLQLPDQLGHSPDVLVLHIAPTVLYRVQVSTVTRLVNDLE